MRGESPRRDTGKAGYSDGENGEGEMSPAGSRNIRNGRQAQKAQPGRAKGDERRIATQAVVVRYEGKAAGGYGGDTEPQALLKVV